MAAAANRELTNKRLLEELNRNLQPQTTTQEGNPSLPPTQVGDRVPPMNMPEIPGVRPVPANPLPTQQPTFPQYGCYDEAPAFWAENAMNGNAERIQEARRKMNDIDIAEMTHELHRERLAESAAEQHRVRNPVAGPPTAMLSYSDTMFLRSGVKSKSDMSNKEWKRFEEECQEWFEGTAIGRLPQSNQTRLVVSVLDNML